VGTASAAAAAAAARIAGDGDDLAARRGLRV
jgi:hypothetical protein